MISLLCSDRPMDGSGAGTAFSSPNRPQGRRVSIARPAAEADAETEEEARDERLALPPGHPLSWGLLTAGTLLDGAPYGHAF